MGAEREQTRADSIIARDMVVSGDITCRGTLRIDGIFSGTLHADRVHLGVDGRFSGEAAVQELHCYGSVDGTVRARYVHLYPTARIDGTVVAAQLEMEGGASLAAQLKIYQDGDEADDLRDAPRRENLSIRQPAMVAEQPTPATDRSGENDDEFVDIVDSLVTALQGGSGLVVVIAESRTARQRFCSQALTRLKDSMQVLHVPDPSGSVRDLVVRIGDQLGIDEVSASGTTEEVWGTFKRKLAAAGSAAPGRVVVVENGETMFPATLEGLLRLLADPDLEPRIPIVLTGAADLQKMPDVAGGGPAVWEPDCLFVLPSA